jgi:hypothetical protein
MAESPVAAIAAEDRHTTGTILLALIAAFSEVSGEVAYGNSMMHLGAIGARLFLLLDSTYIYCSKSLRICHIFMLQPCWTSVVFQLPTCAFLIAW